VTLSIKEQPSSRCAVQFIGRGGRVLNDVSAAPCHCDIAGDERRDRAKATNSNGLMAWTQPVFLPGAVSLHVS
jgi:hypothetical protein